MRLGLYTFASLAFIGLVAGIVYTLAPSNYVLEVAGFNLNLPIALWVAFPLLILLALTILHLLYHGTRNYFLRRKWQRDADAIQDAFYWSLIKQPKPHTYAISRMREGASLLSSASLDIGELPEGVSSKLAKTIEWVKQIRNGDVVDLKEKKVARFMDKDNPLMVQNQLNRLAIDADFANEVLRSREYYSKPVIDAALEKAIATQTFFKLKKYANLLIFSDLEVLMDRADAGEDVGLTIENMEAFTEDMDLECPQYMRLARSAIKTFDPDKNLAWFKKAADEHTRAQTAYLFLLFRYEMLEKAKEFLEEHKEDDFVPFRAFYTLKKNKYNYKIRDLITAENACK